MRTGATNEGAAACSVVVRSVHVRGVEAHRDLLVADVTPEPSEALVERVRLGLRNGYRDLRLMPVADAALTELAERLKAAERTSHDFRNEAVSQQERYLEARAQRDELVEALRYYANGHFGESTAQLRAPARAALAKIGGGQAAIASDLPDAPDDPFLPIGHPTC